MLSLQVDHGVHTLHGLYLVARCPRFGQPPVCQHSPDGVMCTKCTTGLDVDVGAIVGSVCVVELVVAIVVVCDVELVVVVVIVVVVRPNCKQFVSCVIM